VAASGTLLILKAGGTALVATILSLNMRSKWKEAKLMNVYLVELQTDPDLEFIVTEIESALVKHVDLERAFNASETRYPYALFGKQSEAKEYAAYKNLRMLQ
jgi:hypothetical protein